METGADPSMDAGASRWIGVGRCDDPDPTIAGEVATCAAIDGRPAPGLLLVFASERYAGQALLAAVDRQGVGTPLVGCSTIDRLTPREPPRVVVVALGGEGFSTSVTAVGLDGTQLRDAGAEAAACLGDVAAREHRVLILLSAAGTPDLQELVLGAYSVAGAGVPLVGGRAVAGARQFHRRNVLERHLVAAAIGSDAPLGVGARHGWSPVGEPMLVTHSEAGLILELDERPALDMYLERVGASPAIVEDAERFAMLALEHPFGLARRSGEAQVRSISGVDAQRRGLLSPGVLEGELTWLMDADAASVLNATDIACVDALNALSGHLPCGMIVFGCLARRAMLGDGTADREVDRIKTHAPTTPLAGLSTFGQIARIQGVNGFHHQTLVVLAVA